MLFGHHSGSTITLAIALGGVARTASAGSLA
jgi:hypothetical protein